MAVVVDASIMVDAFLDIFPHGPAARHRLQVERSFAAPHLLDAEVGHVVRHHVLRGFVSSAKALQALDDFLLLPIQRYPHAPLLRRAFALRDNATVYDALYLVLAEALDAPLLTRDAALAGVPGCGARVEVLHGS
jgi:predicted nucleic acid-binding protein